MAAMKIHHINCATFCPVGGLLVNGPPARLVCHCLLIETENSGLILVDTGLGLKDVMAPKTRLQAALLKTSRPKLDIAETAHAQIKKLGFKPEDVKHIVVTHLDADHAGGISDFPSAMIHLSSEEYNEAMNPTTRGSKLRYSTWLRESAIQWERYAFTENWFDFQSSGKLIGIDEDIQLISLKGHSCGHSGVVVKDGERWLVHAGDSYFYFKEMDVDAPKCTAGLELLQRYDAYDGELRLKTASQLRALKREQGDVLEVFCAHDPVEFDRYTC